MDCRGTTKGCEEAAEAAAEHAHGARLATLLTSLPRERRYSTSLAVRAACGSHGTVLRVVVRSRAVGSAVGRRRVNGAARRCRADNGWRWCVGRTKSTLVDREPDRNTISRLPVGRGHAAFAIVQPTEAIGLRIAVGLPCVVDPHPRRLAGFAHHQDVRGDHLRRCRRPCSRKGCSRLHPPAPDCHFVQLERPRQLSAGRGSRAEHVGEHRPEFLRCMDAGEHRTGSGGVGPAAGTATPALRTAWRPSRRARPAPTANGLAAAARTASRKVRRIEPRRQRSAHCMSGILLRAQIGSNGTIDPTDQIVFDMIETAIHRAPTSCPRRTASWRCHINKRLTHQQISQTCRTASVRRRQLCAGKAGSSVPACGVCPRHDMRRGLLPRSTPSGCSGR